MFLQPDKPPLKVGDVLSHYKYGQYEIIQIYDDKHLRIKFLNSGYETDCLTYYASIGKVFDPYYPEIFGVACIGVPNLPYPISSTKEYKLWFSMIERCYNTKCKSYKTYGNLNCEVALRWRCLEYFVDDLPLLPGYENWRLDSSNYQLDKDYLSKDNKLYSQETCMFISRVDNSREATIRNCDHKTSKYIGVHKTKSGKYRATISLNGKTINIGTFDSEEAAAFMYDRYCSYLGRSPMNNIRANMCNIINNDIL